MLARLMTPVTTAASKGEALALRPRVGQFMQLHPVDLYSYRHYRQALHM